MTQRKARQQARGASNASLQPAGGASSKVTRAPLARTWLLPPLGSPTIMPRRARWAVNTLLSPRIRRRYGGCLRKESSGDRLPMQSDGEGAGDAGAGHQWRGVT